mgnify:CR=1 FL=1
MFVDQAGRVHTEVWSLTGTWAAGKWPALQTPVGSRWCLSDTLFAGDGLSRLAGDTLWIVGDRFGHHLSCTRLLPQGRDTLRLVRIP